MLEKEKSIALEAVRLASLLCTKVQAGLADTDAVSKQDRSPVTIADYGAQAVINHTLAQAFPEDLVVGEENADFLRSREGADILGKTAARVREVLPHLDEAAMLDAIDRGGHEGGPSGRFWVLDPIDGTKGFLRQNQYAVALALVEDGKVLLGVLGCPNLPVRLDHPEARRGCMLAAVRGQGTVLVDTTDGTESPVRVSTCTRAFEARFCESVEAGHSAHDKVTAIAKCLGITRDAYRMDSQCKYAVVSQGLAEIYLRLPVKKEYLEKIWDHAAGCIIVEEAGGTVTDIQGRDLDFSRGRTLSANFGIIASNGLFHQDILSAVQSVFNA